MEGLSTELECPMLSCMYNASENNGNKGWCLRDKVELKWRFAADLGKGNIVCMECLNLQLRKHDEVVND